MFGLLFAFYLIRRGCMRFAGMFICQDLVLYGPLIIQEYLKLALKKGTLQSSA